MPAFRRNVLVGLTVLVAMVALGWMILRFANKAANFFLAKGIPIVIRSDRANGVAEGSPIQYLGVNVGRVTGVRRVAGEDRIRIDALLDAEPPLPANVRGAIKATSALGPSAAIMLDTVGPPAPEAFLEAGDQIDADYVPDIMSLGDDIRRTELINHLDETVQAVREQVEEVGKLVRSTREYVDDPRTKKDVRRAMENVVEVTENAKTISGDLKKFSARLDDLGGSVGQRLDELAVSLQHFQSVANKIDQGKGSAGQLVNDPKLYDSLADAAAELSLTIQDLRRLVRQWEEEGLAFKLGK